MHRSSAETDSESSSDRSLRDDTRAVTPLIGFILLFGIAVVAFASYQATTVPEQNAQTEFTHSQDVRDDLVDVRSGILQAGEGDRQFKSVKLGTQYRDRVLAVNPSPASGILGTSQTESIDLSVGGAIPTRFLTYEPRYNQLDNNPIVYDTSALYLDPRERGGSPVIYEEQQLIDKNGQEIFLVALQNEYNRQGVQRVDVPLRPDRENALNLTSQVIEQQDTEQFEIEIPTRLPEEKWEEMIGDRLDEEDWMFEEGDSVNTLELLLNSDSPPVYLGTVGIDGVPTSAPSGIFSDIIVDPEVGDLDISDDSQDQTFAFDVGPDEIEEGETVTIEMTDEDLLEDVEYGGSTATVDEGTEGVADVAVDDDIVEITYTAGADLEEGENVAITLDSVDATGIDEADPDIEFQADFIDPEGGTVFAVFGVFDRIQLSNLDIAGQGDRAVISPGEFTVSVDITGELEQDDELVLEVLSRDDGEEVESETLSSSSDEIEDNTAIFSELDVDPGEYEIVVEAVDGNDRSLDKISGTLDIRDIAIGYSEEPTAVSGTTGGNDDGVDFEIQNNGENELEIQGFRVAEGDKYSEFEEFEIVPPVGETIEGTEGYLTDENIFHENYDLGVDETASYQLLEFDTGNMGGEDFELTIITSEGDINLGTIEIE